MSEQNTEKMDEWAEFAKSLAKESGKLICESFGRQITVHRKADSTPVTEADRGAEALMRKMIEKQYPDHQVFGEEEGGSGPEDSPLQWILDPIDGTQSFIRGVPLFGTLIALMKEGEPILGVIHLPCTGELLLGAKGRPTTLNGEAVQVSKTTDLSKATILTSCTANMVREGHGEAFMKLQEKVDLVRSWGDCYGHFMVATGRADVMLDPILAPWDIAALRPCIEGAGGRMTDWSGVVQPLGESAITTNGLLHEEILACFAKDNAEK